MRDSGHNTPIISTHKSFICTSRYEELSRQRNGTNAVQVSLELLERGVRNGRKEVHHPNVCSAYSLRGPHRKRHLPYVMETNHENFFLCQEVEAADRFLDLQALLLLTGLNIPYANSFVVAAADEALACRRNKQIVIKYIVIES